MESTKNDVSRQKFMKSAVGLILANFVLKCLQKNYEVRSDDVSWQNRMSVCTCIVFSRSNNGPLCEQSSMRPGSVSMRILNWDSCPQAAILKHVNLGLSFLFLSDITPTPAPTGKFKHNSAIWQEMFSWGSVLLSKALLQNQKRLFHFYEFSVPLSGQYFRTY